jgi:hypothetical protein
MRWPSALHAMATDDPKPGTGIVTCGPLVNSRHAVVGPLRLFVNDPT